MWKLSIEDDQANRTAVNLVRDQYTVGRDVDNAIRLTERNISRKHALLRRQSGLWFLEDLSSYNGCYVNGKRVAGEHQLNHGDLIQLGDYRIELVDEEAERADPDKRTTSPGRLFSQTLKEQPDRLVMLTGPAVGAPFSLSGGRMVIGRGEDCDLPINDTSVSRVHAEILALGDGRYEIVDLDSSNGVRVNGVDLKRGLMEAGDVIELGDVQLKYVPAGELFQPQEPMVRRNSLEPGVGDRPPGSTGSTAKMVAAVAAVVALALVVVLALRGSPTDADAPTSSSRSPAAETLEEAERLLEQGDLDGAMSKARELPKDSNLRHTTAFREIQSRWADSIFDKAASATDKANKRALLDLVAKSPDVGSVHRKRAANEIAALEGDSVDINELPNAAREEQGPANDAARATPAAARRSPARPARNPAVPPPARAPTAAPAPPPQNAASAGVKGGLVRDTPF